MATTDVYNHDTQYDLQKTITLAEDFMNQEENLGRFHLNISIIPKDKNSAEYKEFHKRFFKRSINHFLNHWTSVIPASKKSHKSN